MKRKIIPGVVAGKTILVFAVTEPNAGSNTFRIETVAKRDGDRYVMNGQKIFITGVEVADYMLVVARTTTREELEAKKLPKSYGLSLFLVDPKSQGHHEDADPDGRDGGRVPVAALLRQRRDPGGEPRRRRGPGRDGDVQLAEPRAHPRRRDLLRHGASRRSTWPSTYAKERKVFRDTPIGAYQGVAHPLAEAKI